MKNVKLYYLFPLGALIILLPYILSFFDGVKFLGLGERDEAIGELKVTTASLGQQFKVTTDQASDLFGFSQHTNMDRTARFYVDTNCYYILPQLPYHIPACSFFARQFGVRINAENGMVFDNHSKQWKSFGYLNAYYNDIVVEPGTTIADVEARLGKPYRTHKAQFDGLDEKDKYLVYDYLCLKDNAVVCLWFLNGKLHRRSGRISI